MKEERILYGVHPVEEALRAGHGSIIRLYLSKGRQDKAVQELIQQARSHGLAVQFLPSHALDRLTGTQKHQGVAAAIAIRGYADLDDLLRRAKDRGEPPLLVILDGLEDPHNLGAILRTAEAVGAHGVVVPERRSVGLTPAVAKASAGAVEHLPVARVGNLVQTLEALKRENVWIYGLSGDAEKSYLEADFKGPVALVAGGEGGGIRRLVLEHCDDRLRIPMRGKVESLNVSVATAVVLYEVLRQRESC
jgi:23S rRNA (guanosine2251-2'-O)-methyltransferase